MELINKNLTEHEEFNILASTLKQISETKSPNISYNKFKLIIIKVMNYIIDEYLKQSNLINEEVLKDISFTIEELPKKIGGIFKENNKIIINENIIKKIYNGDLLSLIVIFHELNHFKVLCDLINNIPDICLYRILKEKILDESIISSLEKAKLTKSNDYYKSNYHVYSEELYVEIKAIQYYLKLLEITKISLSSENKNIIQKRLENLNNNWNNHIRDLTCAINFNSFKLDFYEAFDLEIKYQQKWLEVAPILRLEYYQDENGKIKKRTIDELIELLIKEKDNDKEMLILEIIISRYEENITIKYNNIKMK